MRRVFEYTFAGIMLFLLFACQADSDTPRDEKPEKVYRIVYEVHPDEWYHKQAELWKNEIEKNPQNQDAWYSYYNANRYANFENIDSKEKQAKLDKIINDMEAAIPNTYVHYLLKYWNSYSLQDISLVRKAYDLQPDRPDTYYPFISHYAVNGDDTKMQEFCEKLYKSADIAPWLLNYNYNVLASLEKNAILFTNGDNDTYPVWILQKALSIREDVTVINIPLSPIESFLTHSLQKKDISVNVKELKQMAKAGGQFSRAKFTQALCNSINENHPDIPIYFTLTVNDHFVKELKDDFYIVGLAYKYSTSRIDNLALLKKNLGEEFRLDYLSHNWYNESYPGKRLRARMHLNYLAPIVMLAEHYKISGEGTEADRWKQLALSLAEEGGKRESVLQDIKEKGL